MVDEGYNGVEDGIEYYLVKFERCWMKEISRAAGRSMHGSTWQSLSTSVSSISARPFLDFEQGWLRLGGRATHVIVATIKQPCAAYIFFLSLFFFSLPPRYLVSAAALAL